MLRTLESTPVLVRLLAAPLALIVSIGCGGQSQSLTGPSSVGASVLAADAGADAATAADAGGFATLGRGNGDGKGPGDDRGGNGNGGPGRGGGGDDRGPGDRGNDDDRGPGRGGHDDDDDDDDDGGPGRRDDARVVGFVAATDAGTITVNGVVVAVAPGTTIRHGHRILTLADIEVGDHVQARGVMEDEVLVATEIKVQDTGRDNGDVDEVELRGPVTGLSAVSGCPVVTFTIGTTMFRTSAATLFDDVTCATLTNNTFLEVHGIRQADGSVLATRVDAESGPDEVEGMVFEFSGAATCPAATFRVGPTLSLSTRVTTTAATVFADAACAALANGMRVEIEGTRQADGSIAAARVELD